MEPEPVILEESIVNTAGSNKSSTPLAPTPQPRFANTPDGKPPVPITAIPNPATFVADAPPAPRTGNTAIPRPDVIEALSGIKLPERKDFRATADKKIPIVQEKHEIPVVSAMPQAPKVDLSGGQKAPADRKEEVDSIVTPVHTLKQDLEGIVVDQKMSMIHAAALEQDKRKGQQEVVAETSARVQRTRRTSAFVFTSVILVILGGAALFGVATIMSQRSPTVQTGSDTSLLFAEQAVSYPLSNRTPEAIKHTLSQARLSSAGAIGSIVRIVPTVAGIDPATGTQMEREATLAEFMKSLGTHAPEELLRSLGDTFFFGMHAADQNTPVLIIPVRSYDRAFASMLTWETTLNSDLAPLYTLVPILTLGEDGLPTQRRFQDEVMRNYDTRTLKDDSGKIRMYYSFPSRSILIIAENPYSFAEVLSRLQAQRRL